MPDVPGNKMSLCSRHIHSEKNALFAPEKLNIGLFQREESTIILFISITLRGPTPTDQLMQVYQKWGSMGVKYAVDSYSFYSRVNGRLEPISALRYVQPERNFFPMTLSASSQKESLALQP